MFVEPDIKQLGKRARLRQWCQEGAVFEEAQEIWRENKKESERLGLQFKKWTYHLLIMASSVPGPVLIVSCMLLGI